MITKHPSHLAFCRLAVRTLRLAIFYHRRAFEGCREEPFRSIASESGVHVNLLAGIVGKDLERALFLAIALLDLMDLQEKPVQDPALAEAPIHFVLRSAGFVLRRS